jgi:hypothetical protein
MTQTYDVPHQRVSSALPRIALGPLVDSSLGSRSTVSECPPGVGSASSTLCRGAAVDAASFHTVTLTATDPRKIRRPSAGESVTSGGRVVLYQARNQGMGVRAAWYSGRLAPG